MFPRVSAAMMMRRRVQAGNVAEHNNEPEQNGKSEGANANPTI